MSKYWSRLASDAALQDRTARLDCTAPLPAVVSKVVATSTPISALTSRRLLRSGRRGAGIMSTESTMTYRPFAARHLVALRETPDACEAEAYVPRRPECRLLTF